MHFHCLAVLRIPQVEEDPEETARVVNELTSLELMEEIGPKNIMRQIFIRELKGRDPSNRKTIQCRCSCGTQSYIRLTKILNQTVKSCGCTRGPGRKRPVDISL